MGWHIHTKDGKFNIWSTIVDDYILEEWVSEEEVKQMYVDNLVTDTKKRAEENADEMIKNAKKSGFCGIPYVNMRCDPETLEEIRRLNSSKPITQEQKSCQK